MKHLKFFALALALVTTASQATSLHPDTFRSEVAPLLKALDINVTSTRGEVLQREHRHPTTSFLIGIPATVSTGSACVAFVGQQTNVEQSGQQSIRAIGATSPLTQACIEIFPMPVKTKLTVKMDVLTGGFVAADNIQKKIVQILPQGLFEITLNMGNESVTVRQLRAQPRLN